MHNTETLIALKKSIDHWKDNVRAETPEDACTRAEDCALCHLFNRTPIFCEGCPVYEATGERFCEETPWYGARSALFHWGSCPRAEQEFREAAQAELTFLQALWPAGADIPENVG